MNASSSSSIAPSLPLCTFRVGVLLVCLLGASGPPAAAWSQPVEAARSNSYLLGVNLPWIKYGLDFGASGFGNFGLSSDCSQGFRPERFPGSHGVIGCRRSGQHVHHGAHSLEAILDLAGGDPSRAANGEVTTDLQDMAQVPQSFSLDLEGKTVSAWVYLLPGSEGERAHPNFLQLFVKDASKEAVGLYGEAFNIPPEGGWLKLELKVRQELSSGFDSRHVRLIGVKVGIGEGSFARLSGSLFVDQIESSDGSIAFGFEEPSRAEMDAADLRSAGTRVLRWFVFGDGRASPEMDAQDRVTGLDASFFRDFDAMLAIARNQDLRIIPVLFDFLLCGNREELNGVPLYGRSDLIRDPQKWQSLLDHALVPLLDRYGAAPEIAAWEVMNEPEWCVSDVPVTSRPKELPAEGAVTLSQMRAFVSAIANAIHTHPASRHDPVTLGIASHRFADFWTGLGLDLCQFHLYNCTGCLDEGQTLPPVHECLLGEFASQPSRTDRSVRQYLEDTCNGGYAGALPWSWRGRDFVSPAGRVEQQVLLDHIAKFVETSSCLPDAPLLPCTAGPTALCLSGGRFQLQVEWATASGARGIGQAVRLTSDTGYFTFFDPDNVEVIVKVLDACSPFGRFWVFAAGLTDVEVTLLVTDTQTGQKIRYLNPLGNPFQPVQDTGAFSTCSPSADLAWREDEGGTSLSSTSALFLNHGRFKIEAEWETPTGVSGEGQAVQLTSDTGYFWFFGQENVEVVVKVLDACSFSGHHWVFAAGLTNVRTVLRVEDTATGVIRTYVNPQGRSFLPIQDTSAFKACP